jgi:hypothetical protein
MFISFKYVGITVQIKGYTYIQHIKDKTMQDIKKLNLLSLKKAMKFFNARITLILTYSVELMWEHLSLRNLATLDSIKAAFHKKAAGICKYTV